MITATSLIKTVPSPHLILEENLTLFILEHLKSLWGFMVVELRYGIHGKPYTPYPGVSG
jgi:hypothetical protein